MIELTKNLSLEFAFSSFAEKWFRWEEVTRSFWPEGGSRLSRQAGEEASSIGDTGGVYLLSWSPTAPPLKGPTCDALQYVGETNNFRKRMGQFANSAGFWGERKNGHTAAWRWPKGESRNLWVAFFLMGNHLPNHLAKGLRVMMEAVAIEEYCSAHDGQLPPLNVVGRPVGSFDAG